MKKVIAFLLAALMLFSMSGCEAASATSAKEYKPSAIEAYISVSGRRKLIL